MKIDEPKNHGAALMLMRQYKLACPGNVNPFLIAKALLQARIDGINNPGDCGTCRFITWEGELGTIQACDQDTLTFRDNGIELEDETIVPWGECPLWETNADPGYCQEHKRWFFNDWEKACPECYAKFVAEEEAKASEK